MTTFEAVLFDLDGTLCPGASAALAGADETGSVGLVTNGPERRQRVKLDSLGITDRFDARVYAFDLPRRKPHAGLPVAWLQDGDSPEPYDPEHVLTSVADVQSLLAGEQ